MEDTIYSSFIVKEINRDDGKTTLREVEKPVIGEISLKIYINGIEYASLLCLNQLTEELAIGFLYSEGVIDAFQDISSISYNERLFAVMVDLVPGKSVSKCESLRSVTSGCGKCFTYINPLKQDKFIALSGHDKFSLCNMMQSMNSNVSRGKRKEAGTDDTVPCILESQGNEKIFRRNWARLIQKIYEVDPLICPKLVPAKAGMSGRYAGHQQHRGPFGHPRHSRTPGAMAGKIEAAAENP